MVRSGLAATFDRWPVEQPPGVKAKPTLIFGGWGLNLRKGTKKDPNLPESVGCYSKKGFHLNRPSFSFFPFVSFATFCSNSLGFSLFPSV
jgi:hypothetical protein